MKKLSFVFVFFNLFTTVTISLAQSSAGPVEHMNQFTSREEVLSKNYLSYMSEIAHGSKARKMEKRRTELITSIKKALNESGRIKPHNGDATLRDAFRNYWSVLLSVINEDYAKIIDMEEVAERSYDAMEAYLLIQEKAEEKINNAFNNAVDTYNVFAANNNVTIVEGKSSKLSKRLNQLGQANSYVNKIYLIFFKSTVQEQLAFEAINTNNINSLEQLKGTMAKYAEQGLIQLDSIKPYKGDGSLITACRKVLEFQKAEAVSMSVYSDFLIKKEDFEKTKKAFESKPAAKRTQADVDAFNKAVAEQNKAGIAYNKVNNDLSKRRENVMSNWDITKKRFYTAHFPKA
ncbi:MAG TPA: hypothetical protein VD884_06330 [Ohtaekwangia sp.]|nr:hypothetical protein [Ohtaekwangia sp.]